MSSDEFTSSDSGSDTDSVFFDAAGEPALGTGITKKSSRKGDLRTPSSLKSSVKKESNGTSSPKFDGKSSVVKNEDLRSSVVENSPPVKKDRSGSVLKGTSSVEKERKDKHHHHHHHHHHHSDREKDKEKKEKDKDRSTSTYNVQRPPQDQPPKFTTSPANAASPSSSPPPPTSSPPLTESRNPVLLEPSAGPQRGHPRHSHNLAGGGRTVPALGGLRDSAHLFDPTMEGLTPRAKLRATPRIDLPQSSRSSESGSNRAGPSSHRPDLARNGVVVDDSISTVSVDDLASLADDNDDLYVTNLETGEIFLVNDLKNKKEAEGEGGSSSIYTRGKLLLIGKGKSIKKALANVDTSISTQKQNLLTKIGLETPVPIDPHEAAYAAPISPTPADTARGKTDSARKKKDEKDSTRRSTWLPIFGNKQPGSAPGSGPNSPAAVGTARGAEPVQGLEVHTSKKTKHHKLLGRVLQTQELSNHKGAVWTLRFSSDGKYLASGGHDLVLYVWRVHDRLPQAPLAASARGAGGPNGGNGSGIERKPSATPEEAAQLVEPRPFRRYAGHTGDILDVAWSKSHFLISASMDKTVRLWHITREDCLYSFQHEDFVTAVVFHPTNDRVFLSGSLDKKLRLWSVPDKSVLEQRDVGGFVTALAFAAHGTVCIAATYDGNCTVYQTDSLRYVTQIAVTKAKSGSGRKITGLETCPKTGEKLLVTSNDSRIRVYSLKDYSLMCKYSGLTNDSYQIRAAFDETGELIVCGSEDHNVYIWDVEAPRADWASNINPLRSTTGRQDRSKFFENFPAFDGVVLCSIFAPKAALHLSRVDAQNVLVAADTNGMIRFFSNKQELQSAH